MGDTYLHLSRKVTVTWSPQWRPPWASGGGGQCEDGQDGLVLTQTQNLLLDSTSYSQCDLDSPVHLSEPPSPPL